MLCHTQGTFACTLGCGFIFMVSIYLGCLKVGWAYFYQYDNETVVDGD